MTQQIVIENGLVSVVEHSVAYQVPMADWLDKIEKRNPIFTPVLPVGTRAVYWDQTDLTNQQLVVLIEQQPQVIRMDLTGVIHELSIPYTRFFFYLTTDDPTNRLAWRFSDYRVFWAKNQYNDPAAHDMIRALLPNVYDDGRICFGSTAANAEQSLAERLNQTCNEFYVSRFNRDLAIIRPNAAHGWRAWETMTRNDPTGWMEWRDLDPTQGHHTFYSFNQLVGHRNIDIIGDRFSPMVAAEAIPDVPLGATFGRLQEWLDGLDNSQRDRLLQAMLADRALNNDRYETPVEVDEEEEVPA